MEKEEGRETERNRGIKNKDDGKEDRKFLFWNVAGIGNKDREFWRYIKEFDFIILCET